MHINPTTQKVGMVPKQIHTSPAMQGPARKLKRVHTNPTTQSACPGSWKKCTQAHDTEGGPRELSQVHTSPTTQKVSLKGWGKPTQVTMRQKDAHKYLPSKFRPAAQGRTGEQKHRRWSQGQVGGWWHCSYAERATLKQLWKQTCLTPRKLRKSAQRHTEPIDTPKPTTGHCTALKREEIQLHQPEHKQKLLESGKHDKTTTQPHPQGQTPQPRTTTLRIYLKLFFYFFLL